MQPATVESANAISLLKTLGIRLVEIGDRHALMAVVVDERHRNYLGGVHGGLIATLVDTVCFFPKPLLPSGQAATTIDLNVSYVRPAAIGDHLSARAELLHLGRRTASLAVRVTDQRGRLVAHGTTTLLLLEEAVPSGVV
ncbi:MAG: PaaI family thioesterase [Desulfuromonas sp.]|nr:PaaI family thioesterase [Desulfuromonas sp.]